MKEILEKFEKAINKSLDEMIEPPHGMARGTANDLHTMAQVIELYRDLKSGGSVHTEKLTPQMQKIVNITVDTKGLSYKNAEKLKKEVSEELSRIINVIHSNNPDKTKRY